ncbi:MAG: ABC-F family ATP-binding cassette domain-containing protein [Deferrisomatales bacterium]
MIDAVELRKAYGGQEVLAGATFRISQGEKLALVGPNGSGKTTILRILAGGEAPDAGEVRRPRSLEVGYLPQEIEGTSDKTLVAFAEDVAGDLRRIRAELRELEARMEGGAAEPAVLDRYGRLRTRFEHLDGYGLRARVERILSGLGFREEDYGRPLGAFSGGWRMRAALARILLREPDLVLLDEPTNHLDIDSLEWLESHLRASPQACLIVSHDVAFLDRVVGGVLALEGGRVVRVKGNYSRYEADRALRDEQARAAYENYQRRRAQTEAFVERFRYKAAKARQVQSRLRQLDKEAPPPAPPPRLETFALDLPVPARSGRTVVALEGVDAGYGEHVVYRDVTLRVDRGQKLVLIGPNGAGKSTLLKLLAGVLPPLRGRVVYGHHVTVSYFAQHQLEQLDPECTVLEEMMRLPGARTERELRTLLGAFLFRNDAVDKKVAVLSGGEKSRLVLAKVLAEPGNFLLLDEPTNHLDIQGCAVLKEALARFEGTVCLITHDRDLINRVADRIVYVESGRTREYLGTYEDFARKRREELAAVAETLQTPAEAPAGPRKGKRELRRLEAERRERIRRQTEPLRRRVRSLEDEIAGLEARLAEVEAALAEPTTYGDPQRAGALARERAELDRRLGPLAEAWEEAAEALEALEEELGAAEAARPA